jgi:hypothetical protein
MGADRQRRARLAARSCVTLGAVEAPGHQVQLGLR